MLVLKRNNAIKKRKGRKKMKQIKIKLNKDKKAYITLFGETYEILVEEEKKEK